MLSNSSNRHRQGIGDDTQKSSAHPVVLRMSTISLQTQTWVIPKGCITILAGEGGCCKSSIAYLIASAISHGTPYNLSSVFDAPGDREVTGTPLSTLIISYEDSPSKVIKPHLNTYGAAQEFITTIDTDNLSKQANQVKIGTPAFAGLVSEIKPDLCIIDPLQCVIPDDAKMTSRRDMREIITALAQLGSMYGTSFLVLLHTNKRVRASGRDRIADSSDLWDGARSVLMVGKADNNGLFYLSHEKSNYGAAGETILFRRLESGMLMIDGTTSAKDADFVSTRTSRAETKTFSVTKCDQCKQHILQILDQQGNPIEVKTLTATMLEKGFTAGTIRRAKESLTDEKVVEIYNTGFGSDKKWYIQRMVGEDNPQPSIDTPQGQDTTSAVENDDEMKQPVDTHIESEVPPTTHMSVVSGLTSLNKRIKNVNRNKSKHDL